MNYHDFITLHLFSFVLFVTNLLLFIAVPDSRKFKIMGLIGFLLTGVTGVILTIRFGITADIPMPTWIIIKYASWGTLGIFTFIVGKRFKHLLPKLYWPWLTLVFVSILISVYKPL